MPRMTFELEQPEKPEPDRLGPLMRKVLLAASLVVVAIFALRVMEDPMILQRLF